MQYVPDGVKFKSLTRPFLLSVIREVRPEVYQQMREAANVIKIQKRKKKFQKFKLQLKKEVLDQIKSRNKPEGNFLLN
jgi:hypothetical protein